MDHQVQNHVHIQAARTENAQTVDLEEQRHAGLLFQGDDGGVETLQMTHLEHAALLVGGVDKAISRFQVRRDGLLHQHINTLLHQPARDVCMRGSGDRDDGGIHHTAEHLRIRQRPASMLAGNLGRARRIAVYDRHQLSPLALRDYAGVIAPELADSHHGDARHQSSGR